MASAHVLCQPSVVVQVFRVYALPMGRREVTELKGTIEIVSRFKSKGRGSRVEQFLEARKY